MTISGQPTRPRLPKLQKTMACTCCSVPRYCRNDVAAEKRNMTRRRPESMFRGGCPGGCYAQDRQRGQRCEKKGAGRHVPDAEGTAHDDQGRTESGPGGNAQSKGRRQRIAQYRLGKNAPMASPPPARAPMITRGSRNCQKIRDSEVGTSARGRDQHGDQGRGSAKGLRRQSEQGRQGNIFAAALGKKICGTLHRNVS